MRLWPWFAQVGRDNRPEMIHPAPDRVVGDDNPSFAAWRRPNTAANPADRTSPVFRNARVVDDPRFDRSFLSIERFDLA
jgi:hypothetical protein